MTSNGSASLSSMLLILPLPPLRPTLWGLGGPFPAAASMPMASGAALLAARKARALHSKDRRDHALGR